MTFQNLANSELSAKQIRAIGALITSGSNEEAAKKIGVGRSTLWRWMKLPEFNQALQQARSQLCQEMWTEVREQWQKELIVRIGRKSRARP